MQTLCAAGARKFLVVNLAEGGIVPATHVAWISGSLYDLACWLEWAQISHNAIGPDTLFVSPGPPYPRTAWRVVVCRARRRAPEPLPARTVDTVPHDIVRGKVADLRCDLELIRATGRELLGDAGGGCLLREPSVPRPLTDWLRHPSSGSALTGYGLWRDVLVASIAARRFSRLDVTPEQIYPTVR
jgi:hypothetical protein